MHDHSYCMAAPVHNNQQRHCEAGNDQQEHILPSAERMTSTSALIFRAALERKFNNNSLPFPFKLHEMLLDAAKDGNEAVVSWQPHGKAFRVHKPKDFAETLMPQYFKQTHYKSFQRQLHIYGYRRITAGRDKGAYYHELFVKGKKQICLRMTRCKNKGRSVSHHDPRDDTEDVNPNFYALPDKDEVEHEEEQYDDQHHEDFNIDITTTSTTDASTTSTTEDEDSSSSSSTRSPSPPSTVFSSDDQEQSGLEDEDELLTMIISGGLLDGSEEGNQYGTSRQLHEDKDHDAPLAITTADCWDHDFSSNTTAATEMNYWLNKAEIMMHRCSILNAMRLKHEQEDDAEQEPAMFCDEGDEGFFAGKRFYFAPAAVQARGVRTYHQQ